MKCMLLYSLCSPSCECLLEKILAIRGFNREFTRGAAEVCASWIRVAFAMMVSALIQVILGGSATAVAREFVFVKRHPPFARLAGADEL